MKTHMLTPCLSVFLCLACVGTLNGQETLPNGTGGTQQVLELDGKGSYVELPNEVFQDLEEATVEGWIKWDQFEWQSRFFDFGEPWTSIAVKNSNSALVYDVIPSQETANSYQIAILRLLKLNQWQHPAVVSGKEGMKLYFNGVLLGTHSDTGSFSSIKLEAARVVLAERDKDVQLRLPWAGE